jgi:predicted O-linked N-acetylglucosamine transferase (SPINDLY family)
MHHLNYVTRMMPAEVLAAHKAWAQRHLGRISGGFKFENASDPDRKLKIGYVSPDFRGHAVSYFVEPVLMGHDRSKFEVYCYSAVHKPDAVTDRLKSRADHWRDITRLPGARAAEMIHADQIDILVDLAGHTSENRLDVFAHRPAPVQVNWQGYPNTTGLSAIAYRLTDEQADPAGTTEAFHSEQLVRLPRTAWCYRPPETCPDVSDLPAKQTGRFTFGSFNRLAKVSAFTIEMWSRAVKAVPGSRLLFKTAGLDEPATAKYVREQFARHGLEGDQLDLIGNDPSTQAHLERYSQMDLALDCYPYHGTTTSCEAMWMGVPGIVLVGTTHVSRVGLSLLTSIGLPELAARSADEFVEIAARVASDLDRLAELRRTMRQRMQDSPLMDQSGFCQDIEDAYRQMWRTWCASASQPTKPA